MYVLDISTHAYHLSVLVMHLSLISSLFCTFTCDYSDHQKFKKYGCVNAYFESTTRSITCSVRVRRSQDLDHGLLGSRPCHPIIRSYTATFLSTVHSLETTEARKWLAIFSWVYQKNIRCTTPCYVTPHHSSHFQKKGTKEGSKLVPVGNVRHALNACGNNSSLS